MEGVWCDAELERGAGMVGVLLLPPATDAEREGEMMIWSERRGARLREQAADISTLAWVGLWAWLGIGLYSALSHLAGAGRLIQDGGSRLLDAGGSVAGAVERVPVVGQDAAVRILGAFASTAAPVIQFGSDVERILIIIAALLGLLVVAVAVIPWLNRYVPWRIERLRRLNAGVKAIRRGALGVANAASANLPALEELLASRALHRLDYDQLLEFTPDPFGDWAARRFDRLVEAELETIGLATVPGRAPRRGAG
jgi:hypothetical protein